MPGSVQAGTDSGIDSEPVKIYNKRDAYSWHLMPVKTKKILQHLVAATTELLNHNSYILGSLCYNKNLEESENPKWQRSEVSTKYFLG